MCFVNVYSVSVALDSRLQYGVEEHLFAKIRRYLDLTANILGYSLASVPMVIILKFHYYLHFLRAFNFTHVV